MHTFWLLLPAALSGLVLAAHFLRRGPMLFVTASLALVVLVFVRRPWASLVVRAGLALATFEWGRTLAELVKARQASGEPWERMAAILGVVIAVNLAAVVLLGTAPARRHFAGGDGGATAQ